MREIERRKWNYERGMRRYVEFNRQLGGRGVKIQDRSLGK
jgi:hypothetical protein